MLSPESACFRTEACPWEIFELFLIGEVVSPPTPTFVYPSQDPFQRDLQYDKHMHLQPPFQSIYEHGV